MRALFIVILIAALACLGWTFRARLAETARRFTPAQGQSANDDETMGGRGSAPGGGVIVGAPGTYYAVERTTTQTKTGVKALNPGDEVQLMYRYKDGRVLVTNGRDEFVVKASALSKQRRQTQSPAAP